jgi:hypothetical protein
MPEQTLSVRASRGRARCASASAGLREFAFGGELRQLLLQFVFNPSTGPLQGGGAGGVVRGGKERDLVDLAAALLGDGVEEGDLLDFVGEERDPYGLVGIGRLHSRVSPFMRKLPRSTTSSLRLYCISTSRRSSARCSNLTDFELQHPLAVLNRRAETVDARHRRDDDGVAVRQQRRRGGVSQSVDLFVDRTVLLNERVGARNVGLGLVVVVVGDEELHPILGQHLF